jgi:hypothetical protein
MASIGGFMKLIFTVLNMLNFFIRGFLLDWYLIDKYIDTYENIYNLPNNSNPNNMNDNSYSTNKSKYIY